MVAVSMYDPTDIIDGNVSKLLALLPSLFCIPSFRFSLRLLPLLLGLLLFLRFLNLGLLLLLLLRFLNLRLTLLLGLLLSLRLLNLWLLLLL
jgi:hypothetical protein